MLMWQRRSLVWWDGFGVSRMDAHVAVRNASWRTDFIDIFLKSAKSKMVIELAQTSKPDRPTDKVEVVHVFQKETQGKGGIDIESLRKNCTKKWGKLLKLREK
eukprot:EG_transcript_6047